MKIHKLYKVDPLPFGLSQSLHSLGITPKELEEVGITISVKVPYPRWCKEEKIKELNKELHDTIVSHSHLYNFVTIMDSLYKTLEDIQECPYGNYYLWVKIKDRKSLGQNRVIVTKGPAPDRREAYYIAKDYTEFWDVVERLTKMYENPDEDHIPITLYKNNGMIGSSYEKWEITVQ